MKSKYIVSVLILICIASFAWADVFTISQIDNSLLLVNQTVGLYVNVTDQNGYPVNNLTKERFKVFEEEKERRIVSFRQGANIDQGVSMFLLLDNSGSMYQDAAGIDITDREKQRLTFARNAVLTLLPQVKNPADRIGFAAFNYRLGDVVTPTNQKVMIEKALMEIKQPKGDEGYTEIYEALNEAVQYFKTTGGRKVIILLSDGEMVERPNNPYYTNRAGINGAISAAQKEGISVFTIGLIETKNKSLQTIAENTGGRYFPAYKPSELEDLYNLIRNQILSEYLITYEAGMDYKEKRQVKLHYTDAGATISAIRDYYADTIFGKPQEKLNFRIFLCIPVAVLLLWLLSLLKFRNKKQTPTLDVLTVGGKKTSIKPLTIAADKGAVTIGGSTNNDLTITGDKKLTLTEAKIEQKDGIFTIMSLDEPLTVNNKTVSKKVLRSGDVIKVGSTTIVFDKGVETVTKTKPADQKNKKKGHGIRKSAGKIRRGK